MEGQLVSGRHDRWLADLADRQHGVVAWWQLRNAGFTRAAVDSRLARGRLYIVWRGVYTVGSRILSVEGRWRAAVLTYGPDAVLSHRTAATHLGLLDTSAAAAIQVTVPGRGTLTMRNGIVVHRAGEVERTEQAGIPTTSVARTLLDLAASAPRRTVHRARIAPAGVQRAGGGARGRLPVAAPARRGRGRLPALPRHRAGGRARP
jgi:hypothetical protein